MKEVELRHFLHQKPELAFHEHETQRLLVEYIHQLGYTDLKEVGTGIVVIRRVSDGPFVLLRAEMDALPIIEENECDFRSLNSFMHACGHDFHMACLCYVMRRVLENNLRKNCVFVFQPAEESGAGAIEILKYLKQVGLKISAAIAMHVNDEYETGTIASRAGVLFSASCEVDVVFRGMSAHAAYHKKGRDSIRAAVEFLRQTYQMNWDEDLVWFGRINGGVARNVVAERTVLQGTVRSVNLERVKERLRDIELLAMKSGESTGILHELLIGSTYRQVEVDEDLLSILKKVVQEKGMSFLECERKLTAEDFGYFSEYYPTLMYWFGTKKERSYGLHHPRFLPPDELIEPAGEVMYEVLARLV
ncbi:M20 metallopeptidase family protein [Pseudothermotoga sp. U03pept]|uniref:M20 metallopeptidase family protein n=1 Tax=Pseudothermotoga sp. U03pept TaxID=3447012 RepID=UPI003F111BA5